jgi:hypothetical protein
MRDDIPDWWADVADQLWREMDNVDVCGAECDEAIRRHERRDQLLALAAGISGAVAVALVFGSQPSIVLVMVLLIGVPAVLFAASRVWLWWTLHRIHVQYRALPTGTRNR